MSVFFSSGTHQDYHALHEARLETRGHQGQEQAGGTGEAGDIYRMNLLLLFFNGNAWLLSTEPACAKEYLGREGCWLQQSRGFV